MKNIFEFEDYKEWIRSWIHSLPKNGRGQLAKMAEAAQIFASSLSQVLSRTDKHLTHEQAILVADFMGLRQTELRYFLLLVQRDRAGSKRLQSEIDEQIKETLQTRSKISNRLKSDGHLKKPEEVIFYSNWLYTGIRVLTSISGFTSLEAIADRARISRSQAKEILEFLVSSGLCTEKAGKYSPAPQHTHLAEGSPHLSRHHANWRLKAMERHISLDKVSELAFSGPMSISKSDAVKVREKLLQALEEIREIMEPSPCEVAYCLNIDWIQY